MLKGPLAPEPAFGGRALEAGGWKFSSAALEGLQFASPSKVARWVFGRHAIRPHNAAFPSLLILLFFSL
jgi:hypothetical protein